MAIGGILNNPAPLPEKVLAKTWLALKLPIASRATTELGKFPGVALMADCGMPKKSGTAAGESVGKNLICGKAALRIPATTTALGKFPGVALMADAGIMLNNPLPSPEKVLAKI